MGDNCSTDLTAGIPAHIDWSGVHSIRADDGSVWQRGIITYTKDEIFLREDGVVQIPAIAAPHSASQFFIFAPHRTSEEGTQKPDAGTCLEGEKSDSSGKSRLEIAAPFLWNALDNDIVIDVFYRLDTDWTSHRSKLETNSTVIETQNSLRRFQVKINESEQAVSERQGKVIHRSGKLYGYSPRTGAEGTARVNERNVIDEEPFSSCNTLCEGKMTLALQLNPSMLPKDLKGESINSISDTEIIIGRLPGPHTYYASVENGYLPLPDETLQKITRQALTMEGIKRALLGYENLNGSAPGMEKFDAATLERAAYGMGNFSEKTQLLAQQIAIFMTKPEERNLAVQAVANLLLSNHTEIGAENFLDWDIDSSLLGILPVKPSQNGSWAEDFITLLNFWTGTRDENLCLMLNDDDFIKNLKTIPMNSSQCGMAYVTGSTPKLVLNIQRPLNLIPDFTKTQLTSANMKFNSDRSSFAFGEGEKQILDYRYLFSEPFSNERKGDICIERKSLGILVDRMAEKYSLSVRESSALYNELDVAMPKQDSLVGISLADPQEIGERISWRENENQLSLLQLYFAIDPKECETEKLVLPDIDLPFERDGFEAGILPE